MTTNNSQLSAAVRHVLTKQVECGRELNNTQRAVMTRLQNALNIEESLAVLRAGELRIWRRDRPLARDTQCDACTREENEAQIHQIDMTQLMPHIAGNIVRAADGEPCMLVSGNNEDFATLYVGNAEIPERKDAVYVFFGSGCDVLDTLERAF